MKNLFKLSLLFILIGFTTTSCEELADALDSSYMTLDEVPRDGYDIYGDIWVITDSYGYDKTDFYNLKSAISSAGRDIYLKFPYIDEIPSEAFYNCSDNLVSVELDRAIELGDYAFENCEGLWKVYAPNVESIGQGAFNNNIRLRDINFYDAEIIDDDAFKYCENLKSVEFNWVESIGVEAFYGCTNLLSASFNSVGFVYEGAFEGCDNLEEVYMPKVTKIYNYAFYDCSSLEELTLATDSYVSSVSYTAFDYVDLSYVSLVTGRNNGTEVDGRYWVIGNNEFGPFRDISYN
ncbi:MAG: leucine-rich repeat domain-containing protein [Rikenellaceae bacterium]